MKKNKVIALFDFDGTITNRDSLFDFIHFVVGTKKFILGFIILFPTLLSFKFNFIKNHEAKQKVLTYFFKGMLDKDFKNFGDKYCNTKLKKILNKKALNKIIWHKKNDHEIVIVSASIEDWLIKWSSENDLKLIATRLEKINGIVTGNFSTKNCYGVEKVHRIKKSFNLDDYDYIYAYGDSKGDKEMLDIATHKYFKYFN